MELTRDDIEDLLDALDAWESADRRDNLAATMMGVMVSRTKEEAESFINSQIEEREKGKVKERLRKEKVILLKAKLIQVRDRMDIEEFTGSIDG